LLAIIEVANPLWVRWLLNGTTKGFRNVSSNETYDKSRYPEFQVRHTCSWHRDICIYRRWLAFFQVHKSPGTSTSRHLSELFLLTPRALPASGLLSLNATAERPVIYLQGQKQCKAPFCIESSLLQARCPMLCSTRHSHESFEWRVYHSIGHVT
jgi:hypothetical protein